MENNYQYLVHPNGDRLVYEQRAHPTHAAGVLFLGGFMSNMQGTKATYLKEATQELHLDYVRFDYRGHGLSDGKFDACTLSTWLEDSLLVLDTLLEKTQIVIGSSMGGWLMLLLALKRPEKIKGLIGIAPAPNFTEHLLWETLSSEEQHTLQTTGRLEVDSGYDVPHLFTYDLIQDGRKHILSEAKIQLSCPLSILQGMQDASVPYQYVHSFIHSIGCPSLTLTLIQDGDHGLSRPGDLARLKNEIQLMQDKA